MFLSSWLESFKETIQLSPRAARSRLARHRRPPTTQPVERLEDRSLLASQFSFPAPVGATISPMQISHSSSIVGEPNRSILTSGLYPDTPRVLDPTEITLRMLPNAVLTNITATSNDITIVQSLNSAGNNQASPNLDVYQEIGIPIGNPNAYVRFAAGSALFGKTTITITGTDPTGALRTLVVPVWLNDVPDIQSLENISVPEDTALVSVPLSGITAGYSADVPSNGGQQRLIYANTSREFLTGIPLVDYMAAPMDGTGTLLIHPVKGAPISIANLGDNEATITVTIEDGGIDNIVGKSYDPVTGDVTITNFPATLDNVIRSREFRLTITPENDLPSIDDVQTAITTLAAVCQTPDLTVSVIDPTQFPPNASPNFIIQIDDERMRVTTVTGNVFSVTRGVDGTLTASHQSGARVTLINDVVRLEDTLPGPPILDVNGKTIVDSQGRTIINLTGITPGGGASTIGNEQQIVSIAPTTAQGGFFTLTVDDKVHAYTTDLIAFDAPAVNSSNETLTVAVVANQGVTSPSTFTLTLADNISAVTIHKRRFSSMT